MIASKYEVDLEVFRRYAGLSLPRHVSYPMPTGWQDLDSPHAMRMWADSNARYPTPGLSLYVHIPFCQSLCRYCACTRVVLEKGSEEARQLVDEYLLALEREICRMAETLGKPRTVRHIHWGGGSPTYLSDEQIERIHRKIGEVFNVASDAEIAMEIDPRTAPAPKLRALRELGFNRVSLGVQDFNADVQEHVRRIQPIELVSDTVATCRKLGFDSVNFDLIYGLPFQTVDTVRETIEQTIKLSPDRIAYYHYAQIPEKIANQRGLDYTRLPDSETKLAMFLLGADLFTAAGYDFIGLDHFARSDELLAKALREGTIQRNFQGMTTGGGLDLVGIGASSISQLLGIGFLQNTHDIKDYVSRLEQGKLATVRGKRLTEDDQIRQAVLGSFYCTTELRPRPIESEFGIVFTEYFARELEVMRELERDGLVTLNRDGVIRTTMPLGRVLMRTVAAVFDAYLDPDAYRVGDQRCFSANA
ncbi:MAG: oxygen-independent coproporphyrinogen III oxidase [Phycisphaerae bacterium]|jgi:oxygen-independent coproporphyrinogen-3 oxidase